MKIWEGEKIKSNFNINLENMWKLIIIYWSTLYSELLKGIKKVFFVFLMGYGKVE